MGVNSLWDIVGQTARPVRLESLSRKKLAVDASIWIYQFLKAVRDSEGNALPLSHIVGFFRRICKLLYFGILPIFVFDGGAPVLKRKTISKRKERRDEQRESTNQTARKLLAIQVQRGLTNGQKVQNNLQTRKENVNREKGLYLEDIERLQAGKSINNSNPDSDSDSDFDVDGAEELSSFRKKDEYHLPTLKEFNIKNDDERLMPKEEFQELSESGYNYVDGVDIDSVDPSSKEFEELPMSTQYMILSHLRLRSRLRMGYDKDQLSQLFPDSKDFSKFQIQQVQKRNFYTQRLMNVAGMEGDRTVTKRRVAGSKDREYTLARSENGWTLALDSGGLSKDKPIKMDEFGYVILDDEVENEVICVEKKVEKSEKGLIGSDSDSDEEFEEVPIGHPEQKVNEREGEIVDEDDEIQKAVVQSIYDQYENENKADSLEYDEIELKKAINLSKKQHFEEMRMFDSIAKKNVFGVEPTVPDASKKEAIKIDNSIDMNLESGFFGKSMLFGGSLKAPNDEFVVKISTDEQAEEIGQQSDNLKAAKSSVSSEKENDIEKEKSADVEVIQPKPAQEIPSWFNSSILDANNPHNFESSILSEVRPKEYVQSELGTFEVKKRKYQEDEEAGLISWNEANSMFNEPTEDHREEEEILITDYKTVELIAEEDVINKDGDDVQVIDKPRSDVVVANNTETKKEAVEKNRGPANGLLAGNVNEVEVDEADFESERPVVTLDYDFEEEDEDKLIEQIEQEEVEHEQFKSRIMQKNQLNDISSVITDEQLLQEQFQKSKRDSDEVTQSMVRDVQELLKRFGIPYMTAPMEAEAQCAELMKLKLVDGIITDDSDCFLFGGDRIYKNMFNQKNYVECYIGTEIETRLGLSQDKLIELALLLGSDYTDGIKGIGPVLGMEILAEFGSLKNFKRWFDTNTLTTDVRNIDNSTALKKSLLGKIKSGKFFLPDNFPDSVVFEAYKNPEVDKDDTKFQWGVPNLDKIRSFLMYNVKWTQGRVDEVLVPLIRDINRKKMEGTQSTLGEFFPQEVIQTKRQLNLGKRLKKATEKMRK